MYSDNSDEEFFLNIFGDCSTINVNDIRNDDERRVQTMLLKIPPQQSEVTLIR